MKSITVEEIIEWVRTLVKIHGVFPDISPENEIELRRLLCLLEGNKDKIENTK